MAKTLCLALFASSLVAAPPTVGGATHTPVVAPHTVLQRKDLRWKAISSPRAAAAESQPFRISPSPAAATAAQTSATQGASTPTAAAGGAIGSATSSATIPSDPWRVWLETVTALTAGWAEPVTALTPRERTLNRLVELGAPGWVVGAFDCIGWRESGWANVRSKTGDSGVLQINDVHGPELARLGLDPWSPEDSASFAWLLFTRAGWSFRDWTVAPKCGLR